MEDNRAGGRRHCVRPGVGNVGAARETAPRPAKLRPPRTVRATCSKNLEPKPRRRRRARGKQ
eukprot:5555149-Pyramimonas_sp.AAC.1